jgi:hypothetical protein
MNKSLTKINGKWFELIRSNFSSEEKLILQQDGNEELKSEIFKKFNARSSKLAEADDVIVAESVLINNKIKDFSVACVILPSKHGFAVTGSGWVRF